MYTHIRNLKSYKGKLNNMSKNDLVYAENKLLDQMEEIKEKIQLVNEIIRIKDNERPKPKIF